MVRRVNAKQRERWARIFAFFKKLDKKPDKFYFGNWHTDNSCNRELPSLERCDTSACFAGWLPTMFPRDWVYYDYTDYTPTALKAFDKQVDKSYFVEQLAAFLGISEEDTYAITCPGVMSKFVSPNEWVKNVRAYLKYQKIKVT